MRFKYLFAALLTALCCASAARAQRPPAADEQAAVKRVVDNFMQPFLAKDNIPGAIVGVSMHGRRYFFSYGTATDGGAPFTPTTLVEIGSCTKVFTTTLFALAIQRDQIAPNAPIQQYMPEGYKLKPGAQQVTALELADFTSGMPDSVPNLPDNLEMRGIEHYTTHDFLKWVSKWQPDTPLPAPYVYSNAGIGLLTYLVADATGVAWKDQIQAEIVGPLGMTDTEMKPSGEQRPRLAQGHRRNGSPAPEWPIYAWYGAGALRSTATDMLRFGEANLGHKQVDGKPVADGLIAAMKAAQRPIYPLPEGTAQQAMAWVVNNGNRPGLRPEILKNGGTAGFGTVILVNPYKDVAIFIGVNQSGSNPAPVGVAIGRHLP